MLCSVAVVGYKHWSWGKNAGMWWHRHREINFPHPHIFAILTICPISFDELFMSSIYGKLKFATVLDHIFLLFICSNMCLKLTALESFAEVTAIFPEASERLFFRVGVFWNQFS